MVTPLSHSRDLGGCLLYIPSSKHPQQLHLLSPQAPGLASLPLKPLSQGMEPLPQIWALQQPWEDLLLVSQLSLVWPLPLLQEDLPLVSFLLSLEWPLPLQWEVLPKVSPLSQVWEALPKVMAHPPVWEDLPQDSQHNLEWLLPVWEDLPQIFLPKEVSQVCLPLVCQVNQCLECYHLQVLEDKALLSLI